MFRYKNLFLTLFIIIIIISGYTGNILSLDNINNQEINRCDHEISGLNVNDKDGDGFDFIDELIEAPKNPDAKPSNIRIPNVIREYGMRALELMFLVKNSASSKYHAIIRNLKTIYYRV